MIAQFLISTFTR